jgi:hypothetical protein
MRWAVVLLAVICACGGSSEKRVEHPKGKEPEAPAPEAPPDADAAVPAEPPAEAAADGQAAPPLPAPQPSAAADPAAPPLPDDTDAGEISRATVLAAMSQGIGRFLQRVHAEPALEGGRFSGWRITGWNATDAEARRNVLRVGDVVLRVNGQAIERPEQFKSVWDSMATESQLVLLVKRGAKQGQVRYRIVD